MEVKKPPGEIFMALGYDNMDEAIDPKTGEKINKKKHYRQYYQDELENIPDIFPEKSPFNTFELKRGQSRGLKKGGLLSLFKPQKHD